MDSDEISGRLIVLETFVMTSLGLYLANTRNDPTYSMAAAMLDHLREASVSNAAAAPPAVQAKAKAYSDHLAAVLTENLRLLRGEGGQAH
jgi:hypothetical protein